jgi:hypothetical protein
MSWERNVHAVIFHSQKPRRVLCSCFAHVLFYKNLTQNVQCVSFSVSQKFGRSTRVFPPDSLIFSEQKEDCSTFILSSAEELKVFV